MFASVKKYLVCRIPGSENCLVTLLNTPYISDIFPGSLAKGEYWRVLTSKLVFLDTRDALLAIFLIYNFRSVRNRDRAPFPDFETFFSRRIFERRYGTRKYASHLLSAFALSTVLELAFSTLWSHYAVTLTSTLGLDMTSETTSEFAQVLAEKSVVDGFLTNGP